MDVLRPILTIDVIKPFIGRIGGGEGVVGVEGGQGLGVDASHLGHGLLDALVLIGEVEEVGETTAVSGDAIIGFLEGKAALTKADLTIFPLLHIRDLAIKSSRTIVLRHAPATCP